MAFKGSLKSFASLKSPMTDKNICDREYRKRLEERFKKGSFDGFHDYEVLELVLTHVRPARDLKSLARRLLERFRGLRGVFDATPGELGAISGMNENTITFIRFLKETAGAYLLDRMMGHDIVNSPQEALDYLNMTLSGERVEKFVAIYLNSKNEVLAVEVLHEGTINQTVVYPRKAIEKAFSHNAHSVIFVHNHPSGDASPSGVDRELAGVLERAAEAVDLIVHDHLIVGRDSHFSARENGWLVNKGRVARSPQSGS